MSGEGRTETETYTRSYSRIWNSACFAVFVLIGLLGTITSAGLGNRIFFAALLGLTAVAVWRVYRMATVITYPDRVHFRRLGRDRIIPWDDIDHFGWEDKDGGLGAGGMPMRKAQFR